MSASDKNDSLTATDFVVPADFNPVPAFLLKENAPVAPGETASDPTAEHAELTLSAPEFQQTGPVTGAPVIGTFTAPAAVKPAVQGFLFPHSNNQGATGVMETALGSQDPDVLVQFRLRRLQAYNWGTFHGVADFPIAHEGYLFVGNSGSGKSTMLDGLAALTTPQRWLSFNAAAREADRSRSDRNLVTYVRGAWARQSNNDQEAVQQFLRNGTTWTALAATYRNAKGAVVTLVMLLWIRGQSVSPRDLKHQYLVFEREVDVTEFKVPFADTDFDLKKLKAAFPDAFVREEFKAYQERFSRLLGIASERALRLLHKTQSTKDLGDLNTFLRDFMLDEPETFAVADRLVKDFQELNEAHGEVVSARKQIDTLSPARDAYKARGEVLEQINSLQALDEHLESYGQEQRISLLNTEIERTRTEIAHTQIAISEAKAKEEHEKDVRDQYIRQVQGAGGTLLQSLEARIKEAEGKRGTRMAKSELAKAACEALGWKAPETAADFLDAQTQARAMLHGPSADDELEQRRDPVKREYDRLSERLKELRSEIESLERNPSNIPAHFLRLRAELANELGVDTKELPFAGELMEVRPEEAQWAGAIERVLRGFSLSIVVDPDLYADFTRALNSRHTGMRVVYLRALMTANADNDRRPLSEGSLVRKVMLAQGPLQEWMRQQLRQSFDYECVEDMAEFRSSSRAVTKSGQVKHNSTRHEKDDRNNVNDRRQWVMGLNNGAKREAYIEEAQKVAVDLSVLQGKLNELTGERKKIQERRDHAITLSNTSWEEMDVAGLLRQIGELQAQYQLELDRNPDLEALKESLANQEVHYNAAVKKRQDAEAEERTALARLQSLQEKLNAVTVARELTAEIRAAIEERIIRLNRPLTLESLDSILMNVTREVGKERDTLKGKSSQLLATIEQVFRDYVRLWPAEAGGLDSKVDSAPDFMAKLERLESDGLPRFEDRFMELLQQQSNQNLATLQQRLDEERRQIRYRLEQVNASLASADYNPGTHLVIEVADRRLEEERLFRQQLRDALSQAFTSDKQAAERRFEALSAMVKRLSSQETIDAKWRALVLDVRLHVEFRVRELDQDGIEREVYHSGAGKSGGQRQKLAAACLAAALRYQLGGQDRSVPSYSTVVLDEAFDKADAEFTAAAMTIFKTFGFQMVVATPMRSVMTLEPFIGGAAVIHIAGGKHSRFSQVLYDNERKGLAFTEEMTELADGSAE